MALIDKASLLMVPSTYEAGKLYNVLPSGNRAPDSTDQNSGYDQTRADFDFDRGSNASATRIGSDGLLKKYRENLLLQSNNFGTTWLTTSSSVTGGQSDKDGGTSAWKLTPDTSSTSHRIRQSGLSISGVQTYSLYAKANGYDHIFVYLNSTGTDRAAWFNLTSGLVGTETNKIIDAKIESVGNGWYRCDVKTDQSMSEMEIYIGGGGENISFAGDGTSSVLLMNAQAEKGMVATDYLDSTSVTGKAGVLVDLPRINYDANGQNGSLLLEPSRANSMLHSEFISTYFFFTNASASNNQITSPEGVVNAASVIPDATNAMHQIASSNISASGSFTLSAFVKAGELNKVAIRESNATGAYASFDLSTGTKIEDNVSGAAFIEPFANGWYRIGVTYTHSGNIRLGINVLDNSYTTGNPSSGTTYWSSNGTNKLYVYGLQCELAASYASSYIPTMGTSETRAADDCEKASIGDVVGINEMSFLIEATPLMESNASNPPIFLTLTNNNGQTNICYLQMKSNNEIRFDYYVGGVQQFRITSGVNVLEYGTKFKAAVAVKDNDCVLYVNGTQIGTDTSGSTTNLFNQINCGTYVSDAYTGSSIQKLAIFNERLTNSELATITTL